MDQATSLPTMVGRVGICILVMGANRDREASYSKLIKSLEKDARVKSIDAPSPMTATLQDARYVVPPSRPANPRTRMRTEGATHTHNHALRIRPAISLHVQVPRRLQVEGAKESTVPADEYWVAWDGVTALVTWMYDASPRPFGIPGGTVVLDILEKAAEDSGLKAKKLSCGSNCGYPFAHSDLLVRPVAERVEPTFSTQDRHLVEVKVTTADNPLNLTRALLANIYFICHIYTKLRSHGRVISVAEKDARASAADLLALQYNRALSGTLPAHKRAQSLWRDRKWRKESTRFIAGVWLGLVSIEENKREWNNARLIFDESSSKGNAGLIFSHEYPQEVNLITSLDVSNIRASVEQTAARLDTRFTVSTTTVVALAGAVIGAIAAHFTG
ncbi:hypothetical protein ABZU53_06295 [Micromonospora sp. NPDC005194]|uniref:hypothetical protein n=1 Tax=Micromonospora sp. NPDC005194 TaxID=3156870 RepID=UPI0033BEA29A